MKFYNILWILLINILSKCYSKEFSLVADIYGDGVHGTIVFSQEKKYYPVSIRTKLYPHGINKKYGWEIHEMPILWGYSDDDYCKISVWKSRLIHNLTAKHGLIEERAMYSNEMLNIISFKESIVGNTLIIIDPIKGPISCSTILPLSDHVEILNAKFHRNIVGEIYFISYFEPIYKMTLMLISLYKADGKNSIRGYNWYIGSNKNNNNICSEQDLDEIFNPNFIMPNSTCINYHNNCMIGDLVSKHGLLYPGVSIDYSIARPIVYKDSNLPVEGVNSIAWHSVNIIDVEKNETISCGIIKPIDPLKFKALLKKGAKNLDEIAGIIYFMQATPFHSTYSKIRVKETNEFKLNKLKPPTFTIFDLFPLGSGCENIGNIETDKNNTKITILSTDIFEEYSTESIHDGVIEIGIITSFTLFGEKSILGKTAVVLDEWSKNEVPLSCGQILPIKYEDSIVLMSSFSNNNISGEVIMIQYIYNSQKQHYSDTLIIIDLKNNDGYTTKDHKIHIHNNPPIWNDTQKDFDCQTTGGHFNPYNVSIIEPSYTDECQDKFMLRCAVGDIDKKHGLIDINGSRKQFIDTNLDLTNPSLTNASIVVHDEMRQKKALACYRIEKMVIN